MHVIDLYHKTSTGHRIPGHQDGKGKCARLHGHTYEFHVQVAADILDEDSFVADFGAIKAVLDEWDHRTVLWVNDPLIVGGFKVPGGEESELGVVRVLFIPTAESMARHLAFRLLREFDNVAYAQVEVHESATTSAKFYAARNDLKYEDEAAVTRSMSRAGGTNSPWPGERKKDTMP